MFKLKVTEEWRCEDKNEAEAFIRAQREDGKNNGYSVIKAGYTHKEKKAKGEIIDECEVVSITKQYTTVWNI
ncbi:MAG: hypothetical protein J6S85_04940 [Methanobrevibacter sp.]|nr:hypothetical protein [Methanobrevibacter sp.]